MWVVDIVEWPLRVAVYCREFRLRSSYCKVREVSSVVDVGCRATEGNSSLFSSWYQTGSGVRCLFGTLQIEIAFLGLDSFFEQECSIGRVLDYIRLNDCNLLKA